MIGTSAYWATKSAGTSVQWGTGSHLRVRHFFPSNLHKPRVPSSTFSVIQPVKRPRCGDTQRFAVLRAWSGSQGPASVRHETPQSAVPRIENDVLLPPYAYTQHSITSLPFFLGSLMCAGDSLDTGKISFSLQLSYLFPPKSCPPHLKQFQSSYTLIKTSLPRQLLRYPTNMTSSKFVELLDNSLVYSSRNISVDTSGHGRASSDSSVGTGSPDSRSPPEERVYRDRFPSPTRQSMESPTESPTRRRLRKLTLKRDA